MQQGVQITPVRRDIGQPQEWVGRQQHEEQEAHRYQAKNAQDPGHHGVGQLAGEKCHCQHPRGEHEVPQQQGAFMPPPHTSDAVQGGQAGVGVLDHINDGEVVGVERIGQAAIGDGGEQP